MNEPIKSRHDTKKKRQTCLCEEGIPEHMAELWITQIPFRDSTEKISDEQLQGEDSVLLSEVRGWLPCQHPLDELQVMLEQHPSADVLETELGPFRRSLPILCRGWEFQTLLPRHGCEMDTEGFSDAPQRNGDLDVRRRDLGTERNLRLHRVQETHSPDPFLHSEAVSVSTLVLRQQQQGIREFLEDTEFLEARDPGHMECTGEPVLELEASEDRQAIDFRSIAPCLRSWRSDHREGREKEEQKKRKETQKVSMDGLILRQRFSQRPIPVREKRKS